MTENEELANEVLNFAKDCEPDDWPGFLDVLIRAASFELEEIREETYEI